MRVSDALSHAIAELKNSDIATAHLDALLILRKVLAADDVQILTHRERRLSEDEESAFMELLALRKKRFPIAYILGYKEFYGFEFYVDRRVLIPRPETELLVDEALSVASNFERPRIVDVGTGSGCIAITLARLLNGYVVASDISMDALEVAKINISRLNASVDLVCADGLSFLSSAVDIVVSNPPYVPESMLDELPQDVRFEPEMALICRNGMEVIEKLHAEASVLSRYLIIEISDVIQSSVGKLDRLVRIVRDLSGKPRVAVFKFD